MAAAVRYCRAWRFAAPSRSRRSRIGKKKRWNPLVLSHLQRWLHSPRERMHRQRSHAGLANVWPTPDEPRRIGARGERVRRAPADCARRADTYNRHLAANQLACAGNAQKNRPSGGEGVIPGHVRALLLTARCSRLLICRGNQHDCRSSSDERTPPGRRQPVDHDGLVTSPGWASGSFVWQWRHPTPVVRDLPSRRAGATELRMQCTRWQAK